MALDPQAKAFLAGVEASGAPPLYELTPKEARAATGMITELIGAGPQIATVEDFTIATTAGEIGARRYEPDNATATIFWIHGGGWVICDLDTHDAVCRLLAKSSGCRVVAVDYRRAPEHPFPAPLEDCWDALRAAGSADRAAPLIVAGDSAGGNMACRLHPPRPGPRRPGARAPGADLPGRRPRHDERVVPRARERRGSVPDGEGHGVVLELLRARPGFALGARRVAVARRGPLEPPPAIVITAEYDPLRDEGIAYAERLRAAGVPVTHRHHEDQFHDFFSFVNLIDAGNAAVEQVGAEIRTLLAAMSAPA